MEKSEIYIQIEQRAKAHLKNFSTLQDDKRLILKLEHNSSFIHLTGINRTHLVLLEELKSCITLQQVQNIATLFNFWLQNDCKLILYYNGNRLYKINKNRASAIFYKLVENQIYKINTFSLDTVLN